MISHQGGWDEILLVAAPILLIVALIALAQRRTRSLEQQTAERPEDEPQPPAPVSDR